MTKPRKTFIKRAMNIKPLVQMRRLVGKGANVTPQLQTRDVTEGANVTPQVRTRRSKEK